MSLAFAYNTSLIRRISRTQMLLDNGFVKQYLRLRRHLFTKKITPLEFWEGYKKALLESVGKNRAIVEELLINTDEEMKIRFKNAEKEEKEREKMPPIDLSVPK